VSDPRWRRAAAWFAFCLVVAGLSGVPARLGGLDAAVLPTVGVLALISVAYGVVWPIGTFTLDRPRDWVSTAFGAVWGFCEGALLLSGYLLVERLDLGRGWTIALAFVLLSGVQGAFHALWWDLKVSPEHNDPAWNLRKVLLCHVPNLVASLTHFAVYGSGVWFVTFQTLSLALSARAMRFPRPAGRSEPQPVGGLDDATR
jgi:hypothetical protein